MITFEVVEMTPNKISSEGKEKTSIMIDADLFQQFRIELLRRLNIRSHSRGIEIAMRHWLEGQSTSESTNATKLQTSPIERGTSTDQGFPEQHRRLHDLLEDILNSGIDAFVIGITANLESWGYVVRSRGVRRGTIAEGTGAGDPAEIGPDIAEAVERAMRLIDCPAEDAGTGRGEEESDTSGVA